jgi:hypothetical protein
MRVGLGSMRWPPTTGSHARQPRADGFLSSARSADVPRLEVGIGPFARHRTSPFARDPYAGEFYQSPFDTLRGPPDARPSETISIEFRSRAVVLVSSPEWVRTARP